MPAPSPKQLTSAHQEGAKELLVSAWRRVEICACGPVSDRAAKAADRALRDAVAIATEWGLDPQAILEEAAPSPTITRAAEE